MNAGFSNLDTLKKHLLAATVASDKRFDVPIAAIGLGVAGAFEQFCNRKFARVEGETYIASADRAEFTLPRFPVETLSLIEIKVTEADGWAVLDQAPWQVIQNIDRQSGLVMFPNDPGKAYSQVRFTYDAGYWWSIIEPDNENYPEALPAGAAALPEDLKLAWLMQCEIVWAKRDKLGIGLSSEPEKQSTLPDIELAPMVKQMIGQYIRWQLT